MNTTLISYLLAGALVASLGWHVRAHLAPTPASQDCCAAPPTAANHCAAVIAHLDLEDEQRAALMRWSETACKASAASEARAKELAGELHALLGAPEVDPAKARALAEEIGRLRGQALRSCVDSVIEVRRVLTPQQIEQLMQHCAPAHDRQVRALGY